MNWQAFFLKTFLCSGILCLYYYFGLRNRPVHRFNRAFLLISIGLSLIISFIKIPINLPFAPQYPLPLLQEWTNTPVGFWKQATVLPEQESAGSNSLHLISIAGYIYSLIVLIGLFRIVRWSFSIQRNRQQKVVSPFKDISLYFTENPAAPFSFFRSVYWNPAISLSSKEGASIMQHERTHVKLYHSADALFAETACALMWWNPFFYWLKRELKLVHEFEADAACTRDGQSFEYATLLLQRSTACPAGNIFNSFFNHPIKRRLAMMNKQKNQRKSIPFQLAAIPLGLSLFLLLGFSIRSNAPAANNAVAIAGSLHTLRVVIDAGHGGTDQGAYAANDGITEKGLNLAIARQMARLAPEFHIQPIMTREGDEYPSLQDRTRLAAEKKADLFLSIHVAATDSKADAGEKGFEVYISARNKPYMEASKRLGTALIHAIRSVYPVQDPYKQRTARGIWVLDASPCPAALIECGYLTNKEDLAYISNPQNQEKIARKLLEGIRMYDDAGEKIPK